MFSAGIQQKLRKKGFELTCEEENIWVKEIGEQSVTISGEDDNIGAIWQNFEGDFDEVSGSHINEILSWSDGKLNE